MYADFDIRCTDEYPLGVFCKCGRAIHIKECEAPEYINRITCPYCKNEIVLIRPKCKKGA